MQSSSNKLSTPVSVSVKCKQMENFLNICYIFWLTVRLLEAVRLCYQADVKLVGFQSQLLASCVSSHTDEL